MDDTHETTADVIAAMRDEAARADMEQDYSINDAAEMMREFAWRFEAALKREIEKITYAYDPAKAAKSKAPDPVAYAIDGFKKDPAMMRMYRQLNSGDAAKLREALEQVKELNDLWFDTFTLPDGATGIHDEIENVISAALAAPPRNCDRFQTKEDAAMAFNEERNVFIPQSILWQLGEWLDWLFAPATEKKGENNGR